MSFMSSWPTSLIWIVHYVNLVEYFNYAQIRYNWISFDTCSKSIYVEKSEKKVIFIQCVWYVFFFKINVIRLVKKRYLINTNCCMVGILNEVCVMYNSDHWCGLGIGTKKGSGSHLLDRSQILCQNKKLLIWDIKMVRSFVRLDA